MGAFNGSLTFRQYYVRDPLPKDWKDRFQLGIERNVFTPLDPAGEAERSVGWCSIHFPLDLELTPEQYIYNEYIVLGLRIDTMTVPGSLLRIFTESECRRVMHDVIVFLALTIDSIFQRLQIKTATIAYLAGFR